jgi:hypothetical protein
VTLPSDFQFSQASLQDYVDCERRFQMRYLRHVVWPAIQSEPVIENERQMQRGQAFHVMVQQNLEGVPDEYVLKTASDADLRQWWSSFQSSVAPGLSGEKHPEITLSAPLAGYRLIAKYDLVTVAPGGQATIYDWKTSQKRPKREWLARRLQTIVYPYLLLVAGAFLNGSRALFPEHVDMVYWFANDPERVERFQYGRDAFADHGKHLTRLVSEIGGKGELDYARCEQEKICRFCEYRTLCDSDLPVGNMDELEEDTADILSPEFTLNFEQIGEIAF